VNAGRLDEIAPLADLAPDAGGAGKASKRTAIGQRTPPAVAPRLTTFAA